MKPTTAITALFLLILLLPACGQDQSQPAQVDISMTSIVWQGYANEDPVLLRKFNETMECLNSFGFFHEGYPYVVVVEDIFTCGAYKDKLGCYSANTVFFAQSAYESTLYFEVFKHEVIHWATGLGIENETTAPYFTQCEVH